MKNIAMGVLFIGGVILAIDVLGFIAWGLSGQVAPDKAHAGIISESVIAYIK